ncbi:MAG: electron transfer flavoprotein subunit beta/FixA family protein [Actinomycetes bacterium]
MKIIVCVKQVPDTWAEKRLDPATSRLDRASGDAVLNELDEYAVEEALRIAEATAGSVTVVTMGPERAAEALRKTLQMGADAAVHLLDERLAGSDAVGTSYALATLLAAREFDLVLLGSESTDARTSLLPAMLAERLGLPQMTFAAQVEVDPVARTVRIHRQTEAGYDVVEGSMPAVVSVVEKINEPRYPSFKGIMAAKKKPLETVSLADAGIDPEQVGGDHAWSAVVDFAQRPPRGAGVVVSDDGQAAHQLADFLAAEKLL